MDATLHLGIEIGANSKHHCLDNSYRYEINWCCNWLLIGINKVLNQSKFVSSKKSPTCQIELKPNELTSEAFKIENQESVGVKNTIN